MFGTKQMFEKLSFFFKNMVKSVLFLEEVLDPLLCIKQHKYAILTMPSSKSGGTVILNII